MYNNHYQIKLWQMDLRDEVVESDFYNEEGYDNYCSVNDDGYNEYEEE